MVNNYICSQVVTSNFSVSKNVVGSKLISNSRPEFELIQMFDKLRQLKNH